MGGLIKGNKVEMVVEDGKLHITIDLNINLNNLPQKKEEEEEVNWAIPNFESGEKVKFGTKKKEV